MLPGSPGDEDQDHTLTEIPSLNFDMESSALNKSLEQQVRHQAVLL